MFKVERSLVLLSVLRNGPNCRCLDIRLGAHDEHGSFLLFVHDEEERVQWVRYQGHRFDVRVASGT